MVNVQDEVFFVQQWLLSHGTECQTLLSLVESLVPLILEHGIPLDRWLMATFPFHTQLGAWQVKYESTPTPTFSEFALERTLFKKLQSTAGADSPFEQLRRKEKHFLRMRHTDKNLPEDVRHHFEKRGYIDMYAIPVFYRGNFTIGLSFGTKHEKGFSDRDIAFFDGILPAFGTVAQFLVNELVTYSLLCTYLGNDPGTRVHRGSVDRGDSVTVRSVIWFSDVRGYTRLSQQLDRDQVIDLINKVFEITEDVVKKNGGEIVKFFNDSWLAMFSEAAMKRKQKSTLRLDPDSLPPINGKLVERKETIDEGAVLCRKAAGAALEFQQRLVLIREEQARKGLPEGPHVGVGLHYGDCSYGNVGAPSRLDFTVIGPSVNLASRVEGLCRKLQSCVLATKEFVLRTDDEAWDYRGEHVVKGTVDPVPIFELKRTKPMALDATLNGCHAPANSSPRVSTRPIVEE